MKEKILARVKSEFTKNGFARTTSDEIARAAGVSKRTLYRYFPEKDLLISEVMKSIQQELLEIFAEETARSNESPVDRLRTILMRVSAVGASFSPQFLLDVEKTKPEEFAKLIEFRAARVRSFAGLLREGQKGGLVRKNLDPDFAVEAFLASVNGILTPSFLVRSSYSFQSAFHALFEQFLTGVLAGEAVPKRKSR